MIDDDLELKNTDIKEYRIKTRHKKALSQYKDYQLQKKDITVKIIGGVYPNKKLHMFPRKELRPTLARVKVVLFDTLKFQEGWTFLDVFAGTGSVGLEALSRGASKVIFFDINKYFVKCIQKNIDDMPNVKGMGVVFECNVFKPIKGSPVNVIYLDPPYKESKLITDVLDKLLKHGWINEETIIITETSRSYDLKKLSTNSDSLLFNYKSQDEKNIASTKILFWRHFQFVN